MVVGGTSCGNPFNFGFPAHFFAFHLLHSGFFPLPSSLSFVVCHPDCRCRFEGGCVDCDKHCVRTWIWRSLLSSRNPVRVSGIEGENSGSKNVVVTFGIDTLLEFWAGVRERRFQTL
ncbi:hypothetical protein M758_UG079200 [Ceratodon purpureus]|nr:hypothetical protein M758_UG079200 [Ceratodon purpureus]